jgi:uncharacterized phage-associated protein
MTRHEFSVTKKGSRLTGNGYCEGMVVRPATVIADAILAKAAKQGFTVSNLKLQKLLYYVQGYHLHRLGSVAFTDEIKAWSHGPVVPVVYQKFKKFSWHDITDIPAMPNLPEKTSALIDFVWKKFGGFSGPELEDMTHAEEPWIMARAGLPIGAPASPVIQTKWIRAHFAGCS